MDRSRRKAEGLHKPLERQVHIGDDVWTYQIKGQLVRILAPDRKNICAFNAFDILPEGSRRLELGPGDVKEFIMDKFGGSTASFQLAAESTGSDWVAYKFNG